MRPYKNLLDFKAKHTSYSLTHKFLASWPCLECKGSGRIVDPEYTPYYGSRPDYIKCLHCGGSGIGTRKAHVAAYKAAIEKWRADVSAAMKRLAIKARALAKLTEEEREALGV